MGHYVCACFCMVFAYLRYSRWCHSKCYISSCSWACVFFILLLFFIFHFLIYYKWTWDCMSLHEITGLVCICALFIIWFSLFLFIIRWFQSIVVLLLPRLFFIILLLLCIVFFLFVSIYFPLCSSPAERGTFNNVRDT